MKNKKLLKIKYNIHYLIKKNLLNRTVYSKLNFKNPVIITGTGKSGSYLLYDILFLSEELDSPTIHKNKRINMGLFGLENIKRDQEYIKFPEKLPIEGNSIWLQSGLKKNISYKNELYIKDFMKNKKKIKKRVLTHYSYLLRTKDINQKNKFRLLDKSPFIKNFKELVDYIFPDAKFITIVRDPRAILNSFLKRVRPPKYEKDAINLDKYGTWGFPTKNWDKYKDLNLIERLSWQISDIFQSLLEFEEYFGDRCMRVYYEDFIVRPSEIIKEVSDFINISEIKSLKILPKEFDNFNPKWFDGKNAENHGKLNLTKEELEFTKPLDKWIEKYNYSKDKLGRN